MVNCEITVNRTEPSWTRRPLCWIIPVPYNPLLIMRMKPGQKDARAHWSLLPGQVLGRTGERNALKYNNLCTQANICFHTWRHSDCCHSDMDVIFIHLNTDTCTVSTHVIDLKHLILPTQSAHPDFLPGGRAGQGRESGESWEMPQRSKIVQIDPRILSRCMQQASRLGPED